MVKSSLVDERVAGSGGDLAFGAVSLSVHLLAQVTLGEVEDYGVRFGAVLTRWTEAKVLWDTKRQRDFARTASGR